jgi:AbiV family abortive infection protein
MEISEELWNNLKKNTLSGVLRLLESAQKLLKNDGEAAICAGLYTYAVEEYGKLLMLSNCSIANGKVDIDEKALFGGHGSHNLKFKAAIAKLPDECKHIGADLWVPGIWKKGVWKDSSSVVADFNSRMAIFYCGLDKSKKAINSVPLVSERNLEKAIDTLKTIALGFS